MNDHVILFAGPNGEFIPYRTIVVSRKTAEAYLELVSSPQEKEEILEAIKGADLNEP